MPPSRSRSIVRAGNAVACRRGSLPVQTAGAPADGLNHRSHRVLFQLTPAEPAGGHEGAGSDGRPIRSNSKCRWQPVEFLEAVDAGGTLPRPPARQRSRRCRRRRCVQRPVEMPRHC
jgi:hypothetical protein